MQSWRWTSAGLCVLLAACHPSSSDQPHKPALAAANTCLLRVAAGGASGNAPARIVASEAMRRCAALVTAAKTEALARGLAAMPQSPDPHANQLGAEAMKGVAEDLPSYLEATTELAVLSYRKQAGGDDRTR